MTDIESWEEEKAYIYKRKTEIRKEMERAPVYTTSVYERVLRELQEKADKLYDRILHRQRLDLKAKYKVDEESLMARFR